MIKYISRLATVLLLLLCLCGCLISFCSCQSSGKGKGTKDGGKGKIRIVTTIFPEYDWVKNLLGDQTDSAEVTLLLDDGVDLHSYQPSVDDILTITSCDLFIYVGGESDQWVEDALKEADTSHMVVINLLDLLGDQAREEEIAEGMEGASESGSARESGSETEYDEHVWLSLRNTQLFVRAISEKLQELDPDHAGEYEQNATEYISKLSALDEAYKEATDHAPIHTLVFGDRFPFRYMTEDYGLAYFAAFAGCSAETEASFETITFLAKKVDELALPCVMTIDGSDQRIAETIVEATADKNQQILTLDSMQSVKSDDIKKGISYLSIMEDNLSVLKEALESNP